MAEPETDLDAQVRKADPDRWLSSRFIADTERRADVVALYAVDAELARVARRATQPMLAEIRLTWWSESLETILAGGEPRAHPVLMAVAACRVDLPPAALQAAIEARRRDLDPEPFVDAAEAVAYVDRTAGAIATAVARVLDPDADPHLLRGATRAWGLAVLAAEGRLAPEIARNAVRTARAEAAGELKGLPAEVFPAVAHAALARPSGRRPGPLEARLRITWAVATGSI